MKLNTKFLLLLFFLILGSPAYAEDWAPDSLPGTTILTDGESNGIGRVVRMNDERLTITTQPEP